MINRRGFNLGLLGAAGLAALPVRAATAETLEAREGTALLGPEGAPRTAIWGYGGQVPGPEIRVQQGARVTRHFVNGLPQPTSVHWHGIRIANAMDGVAGMTQPAIAAGDSFDYDFVVPDAGTYWYHPHNRTSEQMARGLYGALIVTEPEGAPEVDLDEVLLLDDWRLGAGGQVAGGFGDLHDSAHGGRIGNWVTVNGAAEWVRPAKQGDRLRLRLVNTANARIFSVGGQGLEGWVVALDGMPLAEPEPFERVVLGPSQRADLIVDVTAEPGGEALLVSQERDGDYALASLPVGMGAARSRRPDPAALPPNPLTPVGDLATARIFELPLEGGAMGRMDGAMHMGRRMSPRDLAAQGMVWSMGGMAGMPEAPLAELSLGETAVVRMRNDTGWPHAMHLHGMHFRQIAPDGSLGPWRDTLLMGRGETADIAFVADNPGDWMLHCHMLEHAESGMMTWVRVA